MFKAVVFLSLITAAFFSVSLEAHGVVDLIYVGACLFIILTHSQFVNIVALSSILMLVKVAESIVFRYYFDSFNAYGLYLTYIFVDFLLMLVIYLRIPVTRGVVAALGSKLDDEKWYMTNADLLLALIQLTHICIGILMLGEHILRNIFGIQSLIVYNNFSFLELSVTSFEFFAILTTINHYFQQKRVFKT